VRRLNIIAAAVFRKHLLTRDSMAMRLAQLINWVAEILDRNLIMVPELDEP
jgi:hypothetical protein